MPPKPVLIAFAAVIGFAFGLLISLSTPFGGLLQSIAIPLLWPARLLVSNVTAAIVANALLYAAAAHIAERINASGAYISPHRSRLPK